MLSTRKPLLIIGMIAAVLLTLPDVIQRTVRNRWGFLPDYPQYNVPILFIDIFVVLSLLSAAASIVLVLQKRTKLAFIAFIATAVIWWLSFVPFLFTNLSSGANFLTLIPQYIPLLRLFLNPYFHGPIWSALMVLGDLCFWALIAVGIIGLQKPRAKRPAVASAVNNLSATTATNAGAQEGAPAYVPSSGMSVAALVLVFFIPVVGLILGYISRNEIARSQGRLGGMNYSKIAIILGWIFIGLGILGGIIYGIVAALLVSAYY
jgi:hypothetical protein